MNPISIYVHIPFCTIKCGYCDFNAYAGMDNLKDAYREAVLAEIAAAAPSLAGRTVATVAFGGGTPGEIPASDVAAMLEAMRSLAPFADGAEVSLEANPGTTGAAQLCELVAAGVNRVSFGAQSFDPAELRFLDRIHSPEAIEQSIANARTAGVASIGLDLIYGLPGQCSETFKTSLERAIALGPDHLSLYALTVEDGTRLALRVESGAVQPLDPDDTAALYELATDLMAAAGFEQYEISNWARQGHRSRHNQVYWTGGDYLALGAGAHGYLGGERYENVGHPRVYIARMEQAGSGNPRPALQHAYRPDPATAIFDWVTLALRRLEGFNPEAFRQRFGLLLDTVLGEPLAEAEAAGVISRDGNIRLTRAGRLLHGEISVRILAHLDSIDPRLLIPPAPNADPG
ncbi:MAG: radical SAM family heme chaperone HemW [Dehalococcoidia bacterium]|nr:radical SAM family heme chaperone HemW [Dehalococcoidia bacterium]